jgi:hypothetical protein
LTGTIETTKSGCLTIVPNDKWSNLTDEDKAFVQKYNSKIKHNESVDGIDIPNGVTIKTKSRRNKTSNTEEEDEDGDNESEAPPSKKQKTDKKKKVQFSIHPNEDDMEE